MTPPNIVQKSYNDAVKSAPRALLEDLFEDYYQHRWRIYGMNLARGVFFGFGSVVGGTLMVALLLWILSFFNQVPFVGHFVQSVQHSVESRPSSSQSTRAH